MATSQPEDHDLSEIPGPQTPLLPKGPNPECRDEESGNADQGGRSGNGRKPQAAESGDPSDVIGGNPVENDFRHWFYAPTIIPEKVTMQKRLLLLTNNAAFSEAERQIEQNSSDLKFRLKELEKDEFRRTAAHYAAGHSKGERTLKLLVDHKGTNCLLVGDNTDVMPMHLSAMYQSARQCDENVKKVMSEPSLETLLVHRSRNSPQDGNFMIESHKLQHCKDLGGHTIAHYAAMNREYGCKILLCIRDTQPDCLTWQNNQKKTVLMRAVQFLDASSVMTLVQYVEEKDLEKRDVEGNTALHYAAMNKNDGKVILRLTEKIGIRCLIWRNKMKQSVLYFAIKNFTSAKELLEQVKNEATIAVLDLDRNTLLHSLFRSDFEINYYNSMLFLQTALSLVSKGVDPLAENRLGQTFLHGTTISSNSLRSVLDKCFLSRETTDLLKSALENSNGLHAIHVFAGRHNLEVLAESLSKLSDQKVDRLVKRAVKNEPHKGAKCLHFACEVGHEDNIKYLMNIGLKLSDETASGQSCIDYAHEQGKVNQVFSAASKVNEEMRPTKFDLCRLLDPAKRALRLPDLTTARRKLVSISDDLVRTAVQRLETNDDDNCQITTENAKYQNRTDLQILRRGFELDSSELYRSGLSLNLINANTEALFPAYLKQLLELKNLQAVWQDVFLHSKPMDPRLELSIIDTMAFFDKVELLPDLILTRQFDLIPACMSLLIRLKPKIYMKQGKHEQLKQLYDKIKSIVSEVLDELYFRSDEEERKLLFKYMNGLIKDKEGTSSGPKFPCRCSAIERTVEYLTVEEMVDEIDDSDLFATACIYGLVEREWQTKHNRCSPMVIFYANVTGFAVFLAFFAWYVTNFQQKMLYWFPDLVLLGFCLSFTMQEIGDFWRRSKRSDIYIRGQIHRLPVYFKDGLNIFDCTALIFMWIGLIWKLATWRYIPDSTSKHLNVTFSDIYSCQMILSTSFLLWGFRSVSFLCYSDHIGPAISMLKSLLILDLVPFFAIIAVIFYSFGVFFFNLLFPVITALSAERYGTEYGWKVMVHILKLPFNLLFGKFDKVEFESALNTTDLPGDATSHPIGIEWFNSLFVFAFLILVNIVMVNLLIARFNLRVARMDTKALGTWRKTYFSMLEEYQHISPVPPPFSFIHYIIQFILCGRRRILNRQATVHQHHDECDSKDWWLKESKFPSKYHDFLIFQATQLRYIRPKLLGEETVTKSDTDSVKAYTESELRDVGGDTNTAIIATLETKLEEKLKTLLLEQTKQLEPLDQVQTSLADLEGKQQSLQEANCKAESKLNDLSDKMDKMMMALLEMKKA